jgi:XTP/dITP diphosphohydrolase
LHLASANPGKLREFATAAEPFGIAIIPLPNFYELPGATEDGATFEENAGKKALHYSRLVPGFVFADDSGLCVHALGGAPGIRSSRFSGPEATEESNNRKLILELRRAASSNRSAHYICALALAKEEELLTVVEGRTEGIILETPRGSGGFGYDPYFFFPSLGKTFAELTPEEKFQVSHRGAAFRKLIAYLTPSPGV